ncbi:AGE family epimerase/isomerase [Arcticibacter tournemirensis]|uniref:Cellobiose 2-epimerase n=1 Tax=Arcticibacter tournemirensis TaxID=699437 RepID=A0A4Q0M834_9SPHI|nr:AGE family epimerase/isomerase [Arcticibacter tournemirensis]RXF69185.1 N-acyl-D-glucosamine 2-epimerase [Arcticibacter tournemirensis]
MIQEFHLESYKNELEAELGEILSYWMDHTVDEKNGGFVGKIDNDNQADYSAPKGSVLNARILWSFSSAYNLRKKEEYLRHADRAYQYLLDHFIDKDYGGAFWSVDFNGTPLDTKKQVYAIAFVIYAFSEYYKASHRKEVKEQAASLYHLLVKHSYDRVNGGFFEAFTREWTEIEDLRLSVKDANEKKTMNTHLHVLEAFTNLYKIWPDAELRRHLILLLQDFTDHIIDKESHHLILFLDERWDRKSEIISYGHDIEASWLLLEAAEAIEDIYLVQQMKQLALNMTVAGEEGLDTDGGLSYEYEPSSGHLIKEKHWWVQAEAMVGFFNAWQINGDNAFLSNSRNNWEFVKNNILDHKKGEWFWGVDENGSVMQGEDKVGLWKCPYHNSRACIEIVSRINRL